MAPRSHTWMQAHRSCSCIGISHWKTYLDLVFPVQVCTSGDTVLHPSLSSARSMPPSTSHPYIRFFCVISVAYSCFTWVGCKPNAEPSFIFLAWDRHRHWKSPPVLTICDVTQQTTHD